MDIDKLVVEHPIIQDMVACKEVFWLNDRTGEKAEMPFGMR